MNIQMVDLKRQYQSIKPEVDAAIQNCLDSTAFIQGPDVQAFAENLAQYLGANHVVPCANGTDALQIAFMALGLKPGDEVIVPCFTYVATAEVIGLLGLNPVFVDVCPDTFNMRVEDFEGKLTEKTKAIVPVHLFGQCCDMEPILEFAAKHNLFVVEDTAQAIGATYTFKNGTQKKAGTMGHIGCTSFFPSKNLGCYGDGGAMYTNDKTLYENLKMVANHGQIKKYHHTVLGVNSRLDTIQAAILNVKLPHLDRYCSSRLSVALAYNEAFGNLPGVKVPTLSPFSTHVFHQYTLVLEKGRREEFQAFLQQKGIPSMIYYPIPLYKQEAFKCYAPEGFSLPTTEYLCAHVVSLPIHTEMSAEELEYIISAVREFWG